MGNRVAGVRVLALLVAVALGSGVLVAPPAVRAATSTETAFTAAPAGLTALETGHFTVQVTPNPGAGLGVKWIQNDVTVETTTTAADGTASWDRSFLAGAYTIVAEFLGGNGFDGSSATAPPLVVTKQSTTTALAASKSSVLVGEPFTLTATVSPNPGGGTMHWLLGDTDIGVTSPVDPATGVATISRSSNSTGSVTYRARFAATDGFEGSTSDPVTIAVGQSTTTTTLESSATTAVVGSQVTLTATVTPNPGGGTVTFVYGDVTLETKALDANGSATRVVLVKAGNADAIATFNGQGPAAPSSATITLTGKYATTTTLATDRTTAVQFEQTVTLTTDVGSGGYGTPTGQVTFTDTFNGGTTTIATLNLSSGGASFKSNALAVGTHTIQATYGGAPTYFGSASTKVTITITGDATVSVTGPTRSYGTFYPVKDGYRDKVTFKGTLHETATVMYRIYSPTGKRIKKVALGQKTGAFSFAWNGRTSTGKIRPAGTYKVVTVMKDLRGNTKKVTLYVKLSHKKLYYYTASKTKRGVRYYSWYATTFAWVSPGFSSYYRGVDVYGNVLSSFAFVGYRFTLPKARVYKSLTFAVLGKPKSSGRPGWMSFKRTDGGEDGKRYSGWSHVWYGSKVSAKGHVNSARVVKTWYTCMGYEQAHYDIAKVRLTYRYGVLK